MRILLTGASGLLGGFVLRELISRGHGVVALLRPGARMEGLPAVEADLARPDFHERLPGLEAGAVVHCAAWSGVPRCEADPDGAWAVNAVATGRLAAWAARRGARMVFVSSDVVFGDEEAPEGGWPEGAPTSPLNVYGRTKAAAEAAVRLAGCPWAVVRPSLMFRRRDDPGPAAGCERLVEAARRGDEPRGYTDQTRQPAWAREVAELLVRIVETGADGFFHAGCRRAWSRYDFGRLLARHVGVDPDGILPATVAESPPPGGLRVARAIPLGTTRAEAALGRTFTDPAELLA